LAMELEAAVRVAVENAIAEILRVIRMSGNDGYLRKKDLEHVLGEIKNNLVSDPGLYERLVLKPLHILDNKP